MAAFSWPSRYSSMTIFSFLNYSNTDSSENAYRLIWSMLLPLSPKPLQTRLVIRSCHGSCSDECCQRLLHCWRQWLVFCPLFNRLCHSVFVVSVVFMTVSFWWLRGHSSLSLFLLFTFLVLQLLSIYCSFSFIWSCSDSINSLLSFSMYSHMQPQPSSG